jgi:undecaprenyl-diphosphatase
VTTWQVIVLAVVQGLTEFLPISSTAHLFLLPWLFGWHDPGLTFTVALHAGTLVAVLAYFFREWMAMLADAGDVLVYESALSLRRLLATFGVSPARVREVPLPPRDMAVNSELLLILIVATIPGGLAGYFLESWAESAFRSPLVVAAMLIGVAGVMWLADRRRTLVRQLASIGLKDGFIIGAAQALAVVPGTSRAGITIAACLFRNLTRESAARFSFMLATPLIAGATFKKAVEVAQMGFPPGVSATDFTVGFIVSAAVGYAAIAFLLRYLQVRTLKIFVAYRLALGGIILAIGFLRSMP